MNSVSLSSEGIAATYYQKRSFRLRNLLTLRSYALLLFILFLLTGPVLEHSDLFAAVLGYSLLLIIILTIGGSLLAGFLLYSRLDFSFTYDLSGFPDGKPNSTKPFDLYVRLSGGNIPPLFSLWIQPHFVVPEGEIATSTWRVSGRISKDNHPQQMITLPHRGRWDLSHLTIELRDTFGFTRFSWIYSDEPYLKRITMYPAPTPSRGLPPYTAQTTSGTEMTELDRKDGEPFDIKRYHPSDGIRRILWKTYAKSGELLSRHPEPSVTPEGTVALYVCARSYDDEITSLAISHLHDLKRLDYDFYISTDGNSDSTPIENVSDAEKLFIDTVWNADHFHLSDRMNAIHTLEDALSLHNRDGLRRISLFVSDSHLADPNERGELVSFGGELKSKQIEPLWIILRSTTPPQFDEHEKPRMWEKMLFTDTEQEQSINTAELLSAKNQGVSHFSEICEQSGWRYIVTS